MNIHGTSREALCGQSVPPKANIWSQPFPGMASVRRILIASRLSLASVSRTRSSQQLPLLCKSFVTRHKYPDAHHGMRFVTTPATSPPSTEEKKSSIDQTTAPPKFAQNLEQKTIDEIKDLHVEALDDVEDDEFEDDDAGPLSWKNPETGERGGPRGALRKAEPTRYGDWELNGLAMSFCVVCCSVLCGVV